MPVRELLQQFGERAPADMRHIADGLPYRDFMTVGVLAKRLLLANNTENGRR